MKKKKLAADLSRQNVISLKMDATFFFERAVRSLDRFHYDKALKYFRRAVEYEPANPVNHCNLAGVLSETGDYEESNRILSHILDDVDASMTECYFYMANNYANMEDFPAAEDALVQYLENDAQGQFLEEAEEMMELLAYELKRPPRISTIKAREGIFEHDKARAMLEEGRFAEAVRILQRIAKKQPEFMAARNNLALAYYYMGQFDKAIEAIMQVLADEPGNLHGLCNLAIFYQHLGKKEELQQLQGLLCKLQPYHQEHAFKMATTMGILGEHETAFRLFRRLIQVNSDAELEPCMYHYTAVAAHNIGRFKEAERLWRQAERLDPQPAIAQFYLSQLEEGQLRGSQSLSYHYHLPFEEQFRLLEASTMGIPDQLRRDPLIRSSFFWALRHGDTATKLQVLQAFAIIGDNEVVEALKEFLVEPTEDDYVKKVAIFVLRSLGLAEPVEAVLDGKRTAVPPSPFAPQLPAWDAKWQQVLELAFGKMQKRYDLLQQHDLEILWVEYVTRVYPAVPRIGKTAGWAAALEYLTAKMHRRAISYDEVALRYQVSVTTVSRNVKQIDEACGLKLKMDAIFAKEES